MAEQATWCSRSDSFKGVCFGLSLGDHCSKYNTNIGNYPACKYHNNFLGVLYSLKSFKCMFTAANHQVNHLPKKVMSRKEWREWPNKNIVSCNYDLSTPWDSGEKSGGFQQKLQELQSSSWQWCWCLTCWSHLSVRLRILSGGEIVQRKQQAQNGIPFAMPHQDFIHLT